VAPELRERLVQQLGEFTATCKRRIEDELNQVNEDSLTAGLTDPFEWLTAQLMGPVRESLKDAPAALAGLPLDSVALTTYLMQYGQALDRRPLLPTMRRALLITAVASAETTFTGVLRRLLYDRGGASRCGTMFSSPQLEKEIRRRTRGSIEEWTARVQADFGLDLPAASSDWDAVREVWARRNVLVHNAGIADKMYLDRVAGAAMGTILDVDDEYLRTAIDLLCGFLLGTIFTAWVALPGRSAYVAQLAHVYATTAEAERRWPLAENLHMVVARVDADQEAAATSQVNAWLARTRWRGPNSVLADVEQWITDGLPRRFTLARIILLGQRDAAVAMLPDLLEQGEITPDHLRDWPLFASLRDMPAFQRFLCV
jgi:hypothetical protein